MKALYNTYKSHYSSNLKLAIPVVISQLGHTLVQVADGVIVGHFAGTIPLAAVSLGNSIFTIILVIGIGISYGLTPLIAQQSGRNNFNECGRLLYNSLYINIISGIILFLTVYMGILAFIDHLDQSPLVVEQTKSFLALLGISIIPLMIFNTFKQFAEGLGFTKQAMMISIWGNVLNIILGIIFVKGLFGIEPMGVRGVGYSTLIDRTVMAFAMGFYIFFSKHFKPYLQARALKRFSKKRTFNILKIGAPVALQYTFEVSAFSGAAILMGIIGIAEQAAHQVAISLAATTYMMASGISAAAAIRSGNHFGKKDFVQLRLSAISSYHIVLVFMSVTALLFITFNQYLPWLYTSDERVIAIASRLLVIAGVFQLFDGAQVVGLGILRGIGDVNIPTWITLLAYWIIGLPVAYFLGIQLHAGATGIWYGLTLGLLVSSVLLFLRFQRSSKKLHIY
ncbi:MATE family efflux transporter [Pedobacter sp. BS3]|uniref:MATE family efflux transporter n=1 Tax=Pedobacter sp. BS3 TaxID=2567937 RepID=UPI0011EE1946|nr:MATE family efflux transporter [Pedobacter sp. BS3]TZF83569.1 MATE family efflux transporter [Pedobacter sp. BS3]